MDNQHRMITGYRELSQAEIDLINEIKAAGEQLEKLCAKVRQHLANQAADPGYSNIETRDNAHRLKVAEPGRWASLARTHLQEGTMALTRAVAQPTSF